MREVCYYCNNTTTITNKAAYNNKVIKNTQ